LYEEIRALPMARMANRLNKLGLKLEQEAEEAVKNKVNPLKKTPSKVPNPIQPLRGNNSSPGTYVPSMGMDDYVTMRNQQKQARTERRKAGLRN